MKTFAYHENPSGRASFTKPGDAWEIDENQGIFCVADSPLRHLVLNTKEYPYDDNVFLAAETFCKSFIKYGKEFINNTTHNEEIFKQVLINCNKDIFKLNNSLNKKYNDPLNYDLAETVGVGAILSDSTLYYGGLEDCYVNVLRGSELKDQVTFDFQIMKAGKHLERLAKDNELSKQVPKELIEMMKNPYEWEPYWCNKLRNNSNALDENGDLVGWGCFTGEKTAEPFIKAHSLKLKKGDHILLFSDGMIPILENEDFVKWFLKYHKNTFLFQLKMRERIIELFDKEDIRDKEKTLIYFEF